MEITFGGERLVLGADRAVGWPAAGAVLVADVHLGKPAAYRAAGVPVPEGTTAHDLGRLGMAIGRQAFPVKRVVVLGDLVHSAAWSTPVTRGSIERWMAARNGVEVVCVLGNHDRKAGRVPDGVRVVEEPEGWGAVDLAHDPAAARARRPTLAGHVHPGVRMERRWGGMRSRMHAPCYWRHGAVLVLPAFGSFTGMGQVHPSEGDAVWAVGDGAVVDVLAADRS